MRTALELAVLGELERQMAIFAIVEQHPKIVDFAPS
jgi:hypothetical protein